MATTMQTNIAIGGILSPSLQKVFSSVSQYASKTSATLAQVNSKTAAVSNYAGQQFSNTQAKIKAALVAGGIAAAGAKVGGVMLDQASSLEQYRNTLNIVMKDNTKAAQTFAWANEYANKTPFETGEIVDATVKLASYGLEAQKVLPLTGDMAAAMGKSIDQATEAVADAQTGELERLKEFGITKDMIVAQGAKNLAGIEIVNNKGQITNQKAFNATLFSLMKDRYSGAMEIQSKTWGGLMSTISGVAKSGLARIAGISETGEIIDGSAFDIAKQKISGLGDKLTQMQADGTFEVISDKFTAFVQVISTGVDYIIPKIGSTFNYVQEHGPQIMQIVEFIGKAFIGWKVINTVSSGIQAINGIYKSLLILKSGYAALSIAKTKDKIETLYLNALYAKDAIVKGVSTVATGGQTAAQWALNAAMSANPITLFIIGIVALIAVFVLLWNNCEGFRNFFISMWQSIQSGIQLFDVWLTTSMQTDWTTSFGALGAILNSFFFIVGGIWDSIKLVFSGVIDFVGGIFAGDWGLAWQGIVGIFTGIMNGIGDVMKAPLNVVIGLINAAISSINGNIQFDVPDWVPGMGGEHFGVNIPVIPMFANGGITNIPSIFGEAGPEAAIPLKRNNPRSISLLEKTAATIGWDGGNKGNSSPTFIYSPQISGNVDAQTISQLKQNFEDFKAMVREALDDEKRVAYE